MSDLSRDDTEFDHAPVAAPPTAMIVPDAPQPPETQPSGVPEINPEPFPENNPDLQPDIPPVENPEI